MYVCAVCAGAHAHFFFLERGTIVRWDRGYFQVFFPRYFGRFFPRLPKYP